MLKGRERYKNTQLCPPPSSDNPEGTWTATVIPDRFPKGGSLRLVTFNINGLLSKLRFEERYWNDTFGYFDILGLQELRASESAVRENLRLGGSHVFFIHAREKENAGMYGVAVLLKQPFAAGAHITHKDFLPPEPCQGSVMQCRSITVRVPKLKLVIVCVHREYGDGGAWNKSFLAHVSTLLQSGSDWHVVVLGDLNCWPGEKSEAGDTILEGAAKLGFLDCTHGTSEWLQPSHFPAARFSFRRLDYILLSQGLRDSGALVPGSGRVLSKGACWGDHVPVECTLCRSKLGKE